MCSLLSRWTQPRDPGPGLRGRRLHRGDSRGAWCNRRATPAAALWTRPGTKADVHERREEASAPMPPMPSMPPESSPGSTGLDDPRSRPEDWLDEPRDEPDPDWPDDWPDDSSTSAPPLISPPSH